MRALARATRLGRRDAPRALPCDGRGVARRESGFTLGMNVNDAIFCVRSRVNTCAGTSECVSDFEFQISACNSSPFGRTTFRASPPPHEPVLIHSAGPTRFARLRSASQPSCVQVGSLGTSFRFQISISSFRLVMGRGSPWGIRFQISIFRFRNSGRDGNRNLKSGSRFQISKSRFRTRSRRTLRGVQISDFERVRFRVCG